MYRDLTFENAIAFAHDIVRIPSMSGDEGAVAERVMSEFKLLRFDETWTDEIGNVFALVKGRDHAPAMMLSSHLDVVDAGDREEWEYSPFSGEIAENCLHGRGAVDCKGPLALQTYAAATLLNSRPAGDVYVVHTVLEECGSWGMAHAMEDLADRISAVILGESTAGDICIGHRGRIELMVTIRGKSAHASAPERSRNPVALLPAVLAALQKYVDHLPLHEVLPRSTLVPTIIETWPGSRNMVPEEVRLTIDWRTLPLEGEQSTVPGLERFLKRQLQEEMRGPAADLQIIVQEVSTKQRAYTGWERTMPISTHGFLLAESDSVVQAAVEAVAATTRRTPAVRPWTFGTDGGYPSGQYSIPTIGYAPGDESYSHTNRERLDLVSARTAYDVYPVLVRQVQQSLVEAVSVESQTVGSKKHLFMRRLKRL
jgi:succinyl-diaminopimelate desuccinylase